MTDITFDFKGSFIKADDFNKIEPEIMEAQKILHEGSGQSSNMTGWVDYMNCFDEKEYEEIKLSAAFIKENCEALIILGIGGSYLGTKAAVDAIRGDFHNELNSPEVYFCGQNLSGTYLKKLIQAVSNKEVCVIVISKSGTTLETALAFRIIREFMAEKYKENSKSRIFVVTDKKKGALREISQYYGYKSFTVPDNIGGRYSVMTSVGLLPMAAAGLDTDSFIRGLKSAWKDYNITKFDENICCQYAAARNILKRTGKQIEILVGYEPSNYYIGEWWKQLFGESEGKEGKGIFPAYLNYTTDLHSMGQYVQEGNKIFFETSLITDEYIDDIMIPEDINNFDKLNYVSGKTLNYINETAFKGTYIAHLDGSVPELVIKIPVLNEFYLGKLFYFFMMSCAISGYFNKIDPFTQPGVEAYKKNIYKLLGKNNSKD